MSFKKIISGLTALVTAVTLIATPVGESLQGILVNDDVVADAEDNTTYPFGYKNADVFVSDTLLGTSKDSDGNILSIINLAYTPVLHKYTYKDIAEGIIDQEWLMGSSVFWINAGDCLNGDFVELSTWKQVMYETIIMDWLTYQFESDEFETEFTQSSKKYAWKITQYLIESGDIYDEDDLGSMSVEDAMNVLDDDFYEQNEILGKAESFNSKVSDIQKVVKTGKDFYKQFSKVLAAKEACVSRIEFLNKVKEVSNDEDLCNAIDVVTDKLNMSFAEIAFNEGGFIMLKYAVNTAWSGITKLVGIPSFTGIKLGKAGLDWLFNSKNTSTQRIETVILYIINSDFTLAYQQIREEYITNPNAENAVDFNNAFLDYVTYQAYASSITEEYIGEALLEGAWNQICNLFSDSNIQTYNDLKGMLDADINICKKWYSHTGKYYNLYNNILANNEYMQWYYDNQVSVTGVYFEDEEVELGLEDDNDWFYEPLTVEPEDATNGSVKFTSSDESVVSVEDSQRLKIKVHKTGTAVITVTTNDGGFTDTLTINVVEGHGKDGFYLESTDSEVEKLSVGDTFRVGSLIYRVVDIGKDNNGANVQVERCVKGAVSINIPKYVSYKGYNYKVVKLGSRAFQYFEKRWGFTADLCYYFCSTIETISIPSTVYRDESLKDSLANLSNIYVDDNNPNYSSLDGVLYNKDKTTLKCCPNNKETVVIPDSVRVIDSYALKNCDKITNLLIPNSVTEISSYAFQNCTGLTNITIPDHVKNIGDYAFDSCTSLTSITIPDSVTSIGVGAFSGCKNITSITIPRNVTSIGNYAFDSCTSLTSITIPDSVTSIGSHAFGYYYQSNSYGYVWSEKNENFKIYCYPDTAGEQYAIDNGFDYELLDKSQPTTTTTTTTTTTPKPTTTTTTTTTSKPTTMTTTKTTTPKPTTTTTTTATPKPTTTTTTTTTSKPTTTTTTTKKATAITTKKVTTTATKKTTTKKVTTTTAKKTTSKKSLKKAKASISKSSYAYTGKAIKPTVTVKYGSTKLKKGTDYTVSYKNNTKTGKATITIKGKGKYSGTITKTFNIVPKKATLSSVKSPKTKTLKVTWKKDSQATGYQIVYATNSKFTSGKKTVTVSKNSTTSKTISKLTKGKSYYVKVRSYKTIDGKKVYGAYSTIKKVNCK